MSSLVDELQRDALDQSISVTELLLKCLVVSTKLGLDEFTTWARLELDGYSESKAPEYRVLYGRPEARHPYHGWQPIIIDNSGITDRISKLNFNQPIGELEHSLKQSEKAGSGGYAVSYNPTSEKMLMNIITPKFPVALHVSTSQFRKVIDAVRKIVLEWSLKLESNGIVGKAMSFSQKEKEKAQSVTYNIKTFIQGNVDRSQIQVEPVDSTQYQSIQEFDIPRLLDLIKALRSSVQELDLNTDDRAELEAEIQTIESQANSPKPKHSILRESLSTIRRILEGATGSLVASGLLNQIGSLFGV